MATVTRDSNRDGLGGAVRLLVVLVAGVAASATGLVGSGVVLAQAPGTYGGGDSQTLPLEDLLNGNIPLNGAVRTRGILEAGPRVPGAPRRYALKVSSDRLALTTRTRLYITPGTVIRDSFDMDADSLNMREIEVVGTFQAGVGTDAGTGTGFWFWSYSAAETNDKPRVAPSGLLAIEDLVGRPARLAKETVKVRGQFRGKNLFGDLPPAGAPAEGQRVVARSREPQRHHAVAGSGGQDRDQGRSHAAPGKSGGARGPAQAGRPRRTVTGLSRPGSPHRRG
jgi:hypothetical protein